MTISAFDPTSGEPFCLNCEDTGVFNGGCCPYCEVDPDTHEEGDWDSEDDDYTPSCEDYDDSMDGDAESALSSCGWGVDEDYDHYD